MADSDDEYDRKRRDKFRGERSSGDTYRSDRRDDRRGGVGGGVSGRDDWADRNPFRGGGAGRPRADFREYRGPRDRYGSPGRDMLPAKRMRPDWGDDLRGPPRYGGYDPYLVHAWNEHYAHSLHGPYGGHPHPPRAHEPPAATPDMQTQPAMLSLKQFLDTQDDGISDSEVLRKYSEYKLEFKRQQLNEFFVAHKDEEWFKNKYHPVDSVKRKEEQQSFLQRRVAVYSELLDNGQVKSVSVDTSQTEPLLRLLDTVVIKLEGGTDDDLKVLDEKLKDVIFPDRSDRIDKKVDNNDDDVIITSVEKKVTTPVIDHDTVPQVVSPRPICHAAVSDEEENWDEDDEEVVLKKKGTPPRSKELEKNRTEKKSKRKRKRSEITNSSSSESESSSAMSSEDEENDENLKQRYDLETVKSDAEEEKNVKINIPIANLEISHDGFQNVDTAIKSDNAEHEEKTKYVDKDKHNTNLDNVEDDGGAVKEIVDDYNGPPVQPDIVDTVEQKENTVTAAKDEEEIIKKEEDDQPETIDLDNVKDAPRPRALHRTSSIFLRNLAPSITKQDIESICKKFDGYLRVAIADPLVERRWYRRGWVTFQRDVNIKEYCWSLNNTRLRDCEMGAIVNRDLSRRVRPVNGLTAHKTIVRADIKLCAQIAMNLDEKFNLWGKEGAFNSDVQKNNGNAVNPSYGFKSNNPLLQNITDYLIEEASAEEDELLGISGENKEADSDGVDRDSQLISVLDCLILYLRIVHSVDFYNHCEYPYEDEMPNRCGIIHARGPSPSKLSQNDLQDYIKNFESKMQTFLAKTTKISDDELKNLGSKDAEAEVEKFVQANTQELAKDKWLCPLSGKKFKGPEFIRKHIFNKHVEKVEEVRKEVEFFNNYLKDPKRPQLPEHPGSNKRTNSESSGGGVGGYRPPMFPPAYVPPPYAAYAPPMMMPGRGPRGFGGGGRRPGNEFRQLIQYRDLDAPQEPLDMFN